MSFWAGSGDEEYYEGEYPTKEEAIAKFPSDHDLEPGAKFWVGRSEPYVPDAAGVAADVLDRVRDNAIEVCGDFAKDWLDVDETEERDLETRLSAVILDWIMAHKYQPEFFHVVDVEQHEVPHADS